MNNNTAAAAVRTLDTAEIALRAIRPDLGGEFATGIRSCATWGEVAEIAAHYVRALAHTVGGWDACVALRDLAHVAGYGNPEGTPPGPMQAELF